MALATDLSGELMRQLVMAKGGSQPVIDSANHFYKYRIPQIISSYHIVTADGNIGMFSNPFLVRPTINDLKGGGKPRPLWPYEARRNGLSYMAQLFSTLQLYRNTSSGLVPIPDQQVVIYWGKVPAILHSEVCHLHGLTPEERYARGEPERDPGGYAIIKGVEKVLLNIENLRTSEAFLYEEKGKFMVRYTSQSLTDTTVNIVLEDRDDIHVTFSKLGISTNSINVFYIFYVLGLTKNTIEKVFETMDNFIIDEDPVRQARRRKEMRYYMQTTVNTFLSQTGNEQEQIYNILGSKIHDKNIQTSPNKNQLISEMVARELFKNIPLNYRTPQELAAILATKIRMLAAMVAKYVDFKNGYRIPDDRDAWGNKQLVDVGKHLSKRFAQIWKSIMESLKNNIASKRLTTAVAIKNAVVPNTLTEQFINSYNKELWGSNRGQREVAVVDILKRDNILASIAHIRRISTPTNRRAKIREKRLIHNTQWGAVCPVMTPEGEACVRIDTMIKLRNGNEIPIGDLTNGDEIITIDPITLQQSTTKIYNHFVKSSEQYGKPILKITTLNGREIICTDDHPFLTQLGWVYARDLNPQQHVLAIYPGIEPIPHVVLEPKPILDKQTFKDKLQAIGVKPSLIEKHAEDLEGKGLLPLRTNDQKLPIIARIAGFLLADGSLGFTYGDVPTSTFCFGTRYDGELFLQDMERIAFHSNKLSYVENTIIDKETGREATHHAWTTSYGGCFASLMLALDLTYGKRVTNAHKPVPEWIRRGTFAVKREFVAGFQGGDGSKITWTKRPDKVKAGKFNFSSTLQHIAPEHTQSLVVFMQQIADICTELGVEVLGVKVEPESPDRNLVRINFSDKEENIVKYMNIIGYRYATTKSTEGYHISEYLKYKHNKIQERVQLKETIQALTNQGLYPSQIAKQLNLRLRQVTSILEYKGNGSTLASKDTMGFEEWLQCTKAKNNCVFIPIKSIESHPHCMIADFTTESENHSMISNGFVTHNCGLIKDTAVTAYVSLDRDESVVRSRLEGFYSVTPVGDMKYPLYLNGVHLGFCNSPVLREELLRLRRTQQLYFDTGIILDQYRELKIFTNEGRICRPLLIVDRDTQELVIDQRNLRGADLNTLMREGALEYIDIAEQEQVHIRIAATVRQLKTFRDELDDTAKRYRKLQADPTTPADELESARIAYESNARRMRFTHCEVDPTAILGISAITMPFAEFNPGPRNTYQASMARQALGGNSTRIELRFDTSMKTIIEPGVPTVSTDAHEYLGLDEYPTTRELIVAITTYGGSNQEDAITFNQGPIDRGLFMMMIYHSFKTTICHDPKRIERICIPEHPPSQADRYSKLDPKTGIVRVGEYVKTGDCLVGKVIVDNVTGQVKNDSLYVEVGKEGVVDEVYVTENAESCKLIRIRIRELRKLQPGDKLASRYSQKGTIGAILPESQFPWIVSDNPHLNGVRPHVIFNPHGIPSRMTMGKLFEILVGKVTSVTGERFNATAFRRFDINEFKNQLEALGFSRSGKERMVNGITGREMDVDIYVGTVSYQLLRHLVKDKMQSRGTGTVQFLTRQPISGIRKEGGLRVGEMERDAFIEHGSSYLLQERLSISSDAYQAIVCKNCGMWATLNIERGDIHCRKCHTGEFRRLTIPYSFKLLTHFLAAANLKVRLRVKDI